jgi:hypothetical protein
MGGLGHRRPLALLGVVALVSLPILSLAQPERREATLHFQDGVLEVSVSLSDFGDRALRERLASGLPQTLELHAEARSSGTELAHAVRTSEVVFDLWDEVYRVRESEGRRTRTWIGHTVDEVVEGCLVTHDLPIGERAAYASHRGASVEVFLRARLNPLTPDTVHRIRRWLARPGGAAEPSDTFFGSFVGLFVNRSVASAEAELEVHTAAVVVP